MLLPPADLFCYVDYYNNPGDGVARLWLNSNFDNITSFTITSQNAYCFGMDNFYIDQEPPPIPEPSTILLMSVGLIGLVGYGRKRSKKN